MIGEHACRPDAPTDRAALQASARQVDRLSGELVAYVDCAFQGSGLSPGEAEVAWLLLKGFSCAEMAEIRSAREKTLRQQAASVYRKASLRGRAELAADFLEDLIAAGGSRAPAKSRQ